MNDNSVTIYNILKYWLKKKRSVLGNLVGTRSLNVKVHPEKKCNQKKLDRESNPLSDTVELFLIAVFYIMVGF